MGGFDSYAYQISVDMGRAPLDRATLDRLQAALSGGAPGWSARVRLSHLGRWPIGEAFDVLEPGSLHEVLEAHRPGGVRAKPIVGPAGGRRPPEMVARLSGADRGAMIDLTYEGSDRSGEAAWITDILVETTQRTVDGISAGEWIERLFRALCSGLGPRRAVAASLGERMGANRRGLSGVVEWLTYNGPESAPGVDAAALRAVPGVEVSTVAHGLLIRLDPSPGPRRGTRYWDRVRAVEAIVAGPLTGRAPQPGPAPRSPVRGALDAIASRFHGDGPEIPGRAGSSSGARSAAPTLLIPRPVVSRTADGRTHVQGARYERMRFAQLDFRKPGAVIQGFEAVRCEFDNVSIGSVRDGEEPVIVRSCSLTRCRASVAFFSLVLLEDSVIDGASGGFFPTATVLLRHVTMRGPIDALDLRSPRQLPTDRPTLARLHDEHYRTVDWALDIREARFKRCDIGGVPGHLVRRDPATQVLVTRARALVGRWREATAGTAWEVGVERLLESGDESEVFVACPRGSRYQLELATAARLREAGVAVPD